jgi:very-short-patch-repair endonuclease/DNA polymerase III delta prime subunit
METTTHGAAHEAADLPEPGAHAELKQVLERVRANLLDMSARNSLLNYTHPRASSLRIVDEVPAQVLTALVTSGGFRFEPLPIEDAEDEPASGRAWGRRPVASQLILADRGEGNIGEDSKPSDDAESGATNQDVRDRREAARAARVRREERVVERARQLRINPSYDLLSVQESDHPRHGDRKLQTLLGPDELETLLQKIQAKAVTAVQETGANMLHLLFGFVEWNDVDAGKTRMAPLVLLPVTLARLELDRATHTFPYMVAASGEDWSTNVTLQEKCKREFRFELPDIEDDENLEVYFARVEAIIHANAPDWRVRRQLTLGLVSFGKILMWRDLDPDTWPRRRPLFANTLFRQILGEDGTVPDDTQDDLVAELRTSEYNIDQLPSEYGAVPPIVVPADSSQHTVLVDVQRGHHLVVQGPPGTGKSQTITNIIADAIGAGKQVLFVAEKKAALDVVARRLADAGLGPFCLALHSHTSNKREFLDDLQARIAIPSTDTSAREMATVDGLLIQTREALTAHAVRLHEPFGALGLTPYAILWRACRLRSELPVGARTMLQGVAIANAVQVSAHEMAQQRSLLASFAAAHEATTPDIPPGMGHPWYGVSRADLTFDGADTLVTQAANARVAIGEAENTRQALIASTGGLVWPESPDSLRPVLERVQTIQSPSADVPGTLVEAIRARTGVASVQQAISAVDAARRAWLGVEGPWAVPGALTPTEASGVSTTLARAEAVFGTTATTRSLANASQLLSRAVGHLDATVAVSDRVRAEIRVPSRVPMGLAVKLVSLARSLENMPERALTLRSSVLANPGAGDRVRTLAAHAETLSRARAALDERFPRSLRLPEGSLCEIARAFAQAPRLAPTLWSGAYRRAVRSYRNMSGGRRANRHTMTGDVTALIRHEEDYRTFIKDPSLVEIFGSAAAGLESPFAAAIALLNWTKQAAAAFRGAGDIGRQLGDAVWSAPTSGWLEAAAIVNGAPQGAEAAAALSASLSDVAQLALAAAAQGASPSNIPAAAGWEADDPSLLRTRLEEWRGLANHAQAAATSCAPRTDVTLSQVRQRLTAWRTAWAAEQAVAVHEATFRELGLAASTWSVADEIQDKLTPVRGALQYIAQVEKSGFATGLVAYLTTADAAIRLAQLKKHALAVRASLDVAAAAETAFLTAAEATQQSWYGEWDAGAGLTLRVQRFDRAIGASGTLARYGTRLRVRAQVRSGSMPVACELLESISVSSTQLPDVYDYVLMRTLAEQLFREQREFDQFSGSLHETRRDQFRALDERYVTLMQQVIAERASRVGRVPGIRYGAVRDLSEESLIRHEINKRRAHLPIREVFRRAGRAIQALKPCVMMGPQAVAQYLPPGHFHFDLVVMDEASQMRPQDALGAIARGAQLVVVGDPHQLGPTTAFESKTEDEDDIEEVAAALASLPMHENADPTEFAEQRPPGASVLERSESILLAAAARYPMRMLRWHYRSRYPQLIAFSNREFYGDHLTLFPHPGVEMPEDGVRFRGVTGAVYSSGLNRKEAEEVVTAVRTHAIEHPDRSLLVVTMNADQREMIDVLLQRAEKDDPALSGFRARWEPTLYPFAVKNLENVQGDERDVVFVSVTYGPDARGIVSRNFGPVNQNGGERRLNVLFTRAKYRLDVFCSFDPGDLQVAPSSKRGLVVLHDYLRYAKEGTLTGGRFTGREPDSDFEIEVARSLRSQGYEVHAQVGVAGYFLDLAVVDPTHPGRYILAVECDGATYHSAKSARDRDRLRQGVLEQLKWTVHRIWSTDWFRDSHGETLRVVRRIQELSTG